MRESNVLKYLYYENFSKNSCQPVRKKKRGKAKEKFDQYIFSSAKTVLAFNLMKEAETIIKFCWLVSYYFFFKTS